MAANVSCKVHAYFKIYHKTEVNNEYLYLCAELYNADKCFFYRVFHNDRFLASEVRLVVFLTTASEVNACHMTADALRPRGSINNNNNTSSCKEENCESSTNQQNFLRCTVPHLSSRQAVSMPHREAKTPRRSWMCSICLVVAERATFVESGKQPLNDSIIFMQRFAFIQ